MWWSIAAKGQFGPLGDERPIAQATLSQHLKVLRKVGLIQGEVTGLAVCCCLDEENIAWFKRQIQEL